MEQEGWSVAPLVLNGIDPVNPSTEPLVSANCSSHAPGRYCDSVMTDMLRRYSTAATEDQRRDLATRIQAVFHANVNYLLDGQFSPLAGNCSTPIMLRREGYFSYALTGL